MNRYILKTRNKHILWRTINFGLSRKNIYFESLRYNFAKIRHRGTYNINIIVNGILMVLDLRDKGINKELYIHKRREPFSTSFIENNIKDNEIIIDIGANIGYYALLEAKLSSKGEVYAIEPIPTNIDLLKRNIELNHYKNIRVFQFAISNKVGIDKMYVYDKCNWCSFTKKQNSNIIDEIDVPLITLDEFVAKYVHKHPTFIRMDVEGYEYQIIKGALNIFDKNKPLKLCIELHPHIMPRGNVKELMRLLIQKSFKVMAIYIEPNSYNYKKINTFNKLRKKVGVPEFGFAGNSYEELDKLLRKSYACIVFFAK